jgi:hypothetical protein
MIIKNKKIRDKNFLKVNKIKEKELIRLYPKRIETYRRRIGDVSETYQNVSEIYQDISKMYKEISRRIGTYQIPNQLIKVNKIF